MPKDTADISTSAGEVPKTVIWGAVLLLGGVVGWGLHGWWNLRSQNWAAASRWCASEGKSYEPGKSFEPILYRTDGVYVCVGSDNVMRVVPERALQPGYYVTSTAPSR